MSSLRLDEDDMEIMLRSLVYQYMYNQPESKPPLGLQSLASPVLRPRTTKGVETEKGQGTETRGERLLRTQCTRNTRTGQYD